MKWMNWMVVGTTAFVMACGGSTEQEPEGIDIDVNNVAEGGCESDDDCEGACDLETGMCMEVAANGMPGDIFGDVTLTAVYTPTSDTITPDLGFHFERDELWLVHKRPAVEGELCVQADPRSERCFSLAGFTTIITDPGGENQSAQIKEDGNSWHFMRRPPAIAMARDGDFFGTCGEASTGNFEDNPAMFIGPSLWSADPAVYAQPSGGNGSHLDMLHATPWCVGMAHERDNVYWLFNGHVGSIDRYDFGEDHGPGNDDHSDGEIRRYIEGELSRVEEVPGHMEFDTESSLLYVADTGNGRVLSLDTTSGTAGTAFQPVYEPLADYGYMMNPTFTEFVGAGTVDQPAGLTLDTERVYVGDHASGLIHVFDKEGAELGTVDTELGAGALGGIEIGPEGNLWFVDMVKGTVYRVDPS